MLFLQAVGGGGVTYTTQLLNNTSISTINSLVFSSGGSPASGTYTYNFVIGDQTNLAINYAGTGDALGAISARNGAALNANISGLGSLAVSAPSGNLRAGVNASGSTNPIGGI